MSELKVPKIRFKEFSGEWEEKKSTEIFNCITDKNHPEEEVLTILQGKGTIARSNSGININFDDRSKKIYKKVCKNDFIIHLRSFQGGLEIANSNGIVSPAYTILRNNIPINYNFYKLYFRNNKFINKNLAKTVEGVRDGKQISNRQFKDVLIVYTSLLEQKKIANFLSSLDERIELLESKLKKLENAKKGYMQKIFGRELRFKDKNGNGYSKWEEKKLGEIFNERTIRIRDVEEELELLSVTIADGVIKQSKSNKRNTVSSNNGNYKVVRKGDIPYNSMRMWQGACGASNYDGYVSPAYTILQPKLNVLSKFFEYLFKQYNSLCKFEKFSQGVTSDTWNLKYPKISKIGFYVPCFKEQQKIVDFLTIFDTQIELTTEQIDHWKNVKKGLLQQMFM